ncbi:MAG: hypothetical protein IPL52_07470 [Flavobacteriales bacterium]|nr:hypothetical protein [Flavobacteriales bacterium]
MRFPSPSLLIVLLVTAVTVAISVTGLWKDSHAEMADSIVRSDVKGYYGYLQATFIRHDLGSEPYQWEYVRRTPTGTLNKYFCGTALMMAPWFGIGHAFALADPTAPRNGLSVHEMRAISVGAWAYLLIGLLALRRLLLGLGLREAVVAWSLVAIGFGTQLMQYAALQPGWSHVHSFCLMALFLLTVQKLSTAMGPRWVLSAAACLALIVLVRPVNGLVVLAAPVVAGPSFVPMLMRVMQHHATLFAALLLGIGIAFIQPLLWHAQVGHWLAYGYEGEGFHWTRPEVFKVLFGFRRGLFLWTPVLLFALLGTWQFILKERSRAWWMLLWWAANVYIISAWWIWYYGSGFGARVFVDHYPVLAVPIALLLESARPSLWKAARAFILLCCALLLFQMWQYHAFILHHESMDRAKYMYTFLRLDERYRGALAGNYQAPPYNPNGMESVLEESCDFEHTCTHWSGGAIHRVPEAFSGAHAAVFVDSVEFGLGFNTEAGALPIGRALYLEVGFQRLERSAGRSSSLLAVTDVVRRDGSHAYYEPFRINPMPPVVGRWEQVEYRIPVPPLEVGDRLSFYFWNSEHSAEVLIDDVFMRVNAVRPY